MNYIPSHEEYLEEKCTRLEDSIDRLMEENRELRSELSALKSTTQSDLDFVETLFLNRTVDMVQCDLVNAAKDVAAHTNPIRAQLKEAVGLLRDVQESCAGADSPAAKNVKLGAALCRVRTFLATIHGNEGVVNG